MPCTAEEIAEKKRQALERLKRKQMQNDQASTSTASTSNAQLAISPGDKAKGANSFYGCQTAAITNVLSSYENKIKHQSESKQTNRILSQPYSNRPTKNAISSMTAAPAEKKLAPVFRNVITCTCAMVSYDRFEVVPSGFHAKLLDVFKTLATRKYDNNTRIWSFHLKDYELLLDRVSPLNPDVVIGTLPKFVLNLLNQPKNEPDQMCLAAIEPKLRNALMGFQIEGVCFGIDKGGRCMIADDMGLGKTYQALAIADFYRDDWPLLVCTTASTRDTWGDQVRNLLPSVPVQYISVLTSMTDYVGDARVLITSYPMMERNIDRLCEKKFGCLILDESHSLKNFKTKSTTAAVKLANVAKRVILLTGTPALSRPVELFSQLQIIDKKFFSFREYSARYCAGKQSTFGWDASGQSNLKELNVILSRKFMIRRTKEQVEFELRQKHRETILLDPSKVWSSKNDSAKEAVENAKEYSNDLSKYKGKQREEILLKFYGETARIKTHAVCSYLTDLIKEKIKFIVFAHHHVMMNAIAKCLTNLNVDFIRIDGSTRNDVRSANVKKFQSEDKCRVAVLSLKACNAGITLTAAKMVIFAELDWNPSTLAQAEARAHRIGQQDEVTCRYLLAKGTADDEIWLMVQKKQSTLSKAGLFSEDLSDATHSSAPIMDNHSVTEYFESNPSISKAADKENNNKSAQPAEKNELVNFLDDGNDDDFMDLDL